MTEGITIHRAAVDDAEGICSIWEAIVAERDYSAVGRAFTIEEEKTYLGSLAPRESVFVAQAAGQVIGFQTLDLWLRYMSTMVHVGQLGTFVRREWRGRSVGRRLAGHTWPFARENGYQKLVIFVRGMNLGAQRFYKGLGFVECGRLARQVRLAGEYDDEILMELFL